MKKILIFFVFTIIFGYFITLLIIKNSFNITQIKNNINTELLSKIEEYNKHYLFQKKEIKFAIRGSTNLMVFPNIRLVVNDVDIRNTQYKDILISTNISKIEIKLNFLDFFKKKITPKKINLSGINVVFGNNKLQDFYLKKEIKKRIVKLDNNEVFGVKDKLKNLLTSSNDNKTEIEEGYKEVEIEEETRYDLDNSKVKFMFIDLFKTLKIKEFNNTNIPEIEFSNTIASIIDNGNIQKEFKNISGKLNIKNTQEYKLFINFSLNNINGSTTIDGKLENDKYMIDCSIKNELNDVIKINYNGDNIFIEDFNNIKSIANLEVNTENFNNLIQWVFPVNSLYYSMFNYKKHFSLNTQIEKNINEYSLKNIDVNGEDIKLKGSIDLLNDKNNINIDIENINFDEFVVNIAKDKQTPNSDNITIFKANDFSNLLETLENSKTNKIKDTNFSLTFKKISKQDKNIVDSNINFEIINNTYRINSLLLNFDNIKIQADKPENTNNLYYNTLHITGSDFSRLAKMINLDSVIKIKEFNLSSKLIIHNNIIYLMDYELNNSNKETLNKISGDIEYSFNKNGTYLATNLNIDKLDIKFENKQTKTLKEQFIWLNNLTANNTFINLTINNLNYNNFNNASLKAKANYHSGYLNIYNIEQINTSIFDNLQGNILINLGTKNPTLNINIFAENFHYNLDLINYIFDIEKYKQLLTREDINKEIQDKYWINKLFSIPTWEEINGELKIQIQNFKLNNTILNNINIDANINNGLIDLNNLLFVGLGGSTELRGKIDLKTAKSMNLVLTETTYNIEDLINLFAQNNIDSIKGTLGIGGIIQANGFNSGVFSASMSSTFKFIGKDIYIKQLGLENLKENLKKIYSDENLLKTLNVKESVFDNSGTTFSNVNGSLNIANGINNLTVEAKADSISNKLISKIDNSGKNITINMINTSIIMNKVGDTSIPLYGIVTFKEDFANKANLIINFNQIEEYVNKIRKTKGL